MQKTITLSPKKQISLALASVAVALFYSAWINGAPAPLGDWDVFLAAARTPFSPYISQGYYNPPWAMWIVWPLSVLPSAVSVFVLRSMIVFSLLSLTIRRGGDWLSIALVFSAAPTIGLILQANLDFLLSLALFPGVHQNLALPMLLVKPQTGLGVAAIWLRAQWLKGDRKSFALFLLPTLSVGIASLVIYGLWPLEILRQAAHLQTATWNLAKFFPAGVPLGLFLGGIALFHNDDFWALSAMIFLSPYLALYSLAPWYAVLVSRTPRRRWWVAFLAWLGLWALVFLPLLG